MGGRSWAQRGPWPGSSQLLDRTERWEQAASQQGPCPQGASLNPSPHRPRALRYLLGRCRFFRVSP